MLSSSTAPFVTPSKLSHVSIRSMANGFPCSEKAADAIGVFQRFVYVAVTRQRWEDAPFQPYIQYSI